MIIGDVFWLPGQIPPGPGYRLKITDAKSHTFRNGRAGVAVSLEIVEAPKGAEDFIGRKLTERFVLDDPGAWRLAELLRACGVRTTGGRLRFRRDNLIGKTVVADIVHEIFRGELYERVRRIQAASGRR